MKKRSPKIRPTYLTRADKEINADWKSRVQVGCAAFDHLTEVRLDDVAVPMNGYTITEAALIREGMRMLARDIQDRILSTEGDNAIN